MEMEDFIFPLTEAYQLRDGDPDSPVRVIAET